MPILRASLVWGVSMAALYLAFASIRGVTAPPPADCTDWIWCNPRYVGFVFDPSPRPEHLYALLAIANAFLAFLAAHVAGFGASARKHWFMAGPVLALVGSVIYAISPVSAGWVFTDVAASYPPAIWAVGTQIGLFAGVMLGLPAALLTLLGALLWRARTRRRRR